jgi:hypothetical protein
MGANEAVHVDQARFRLFVRSAPSLCTDMHNTRKQPKVILCSYPVQLIMAGTVEELIYILANRSSPALPLLERIVKDTRHILGVPELRAYALTEDQQLNETFPESSELATNMRLDEESPIRMRGRALCMSTEDSHPSTLSSVATTAASPAHRSRRSISALAQEKVQRRVQFILSRLAILKTQVSATSVSSTGKRAENRKTSTRTTIHGFGKDIRSEKNLQGRVYEFCPPVATSSASLLAAPRM